MIRIRPAARADAARLSEFGAATFRASFEAENAREDMSRYVAQSFAPELQAAEIDDPAGAVLLAEERDGSGATELVGYAHLASGLAPDAVRGPAPIELKRLYVARAWHGQGVAQALMDAALEIARARGAQTIWLGVWERNPRAAAFYAKYGFTRVGEHDFVLGTDVQTDWLMARALGPSLAGAARLDDFDNVYEDAERADAYATLEFPGTYHLAFRDIPALIVRHVTGTRALDFGCGAGRSSRFLARLGFDVVGADISREMLERARRADPAGDYRDVDDGDLSALSGERFDVVLSAFTFDNIPTLERKRALLRQLGELLGPDGRMINLVSAPEIYTHEWTSFSTRDFPGNADARTGDVVRIVMLDVADRRPVEDVLCTDTSYRGLFRDAGLELLETHRPLGAADEPYAWVTETTVSPWAIYVLSRASG